MTANEATERFKEIVGDDLSDGEVNLRIRWSDRSSGEKALADIREMRRKLVILNREVSAHIAPGTTINSSVDPWRDAMEAMGQNLIRAVQGKKPMKSNSDQFARALKQRNSVPFAKLKQDIQNMLAALGSARDQILLSVEYTGKEIEADAGIKPSEPVGGAALYFFIADEVKGPFSDHQVKALIDTGVVTAGTLCCLEGSTEWKLFSDHC